MIDCDSNFTVTKNFALTIVSEGDAITCGVILFKRSKHLILYGYMICASTI
jgi:hypothetical protein